MASAYPGDFDDDLEEEFEEQDELVPPMVEDFILNLRRAILDRNVNQVQELYENAFNQLTESYYKTKSWPQEATVRSIIHYSHDDEPFIILYNDLYYRHLYATSSTIESKHRFDSYTNYCNLFNLILRTEKPVNLELPNQWLWDIIDEFIYQFQAFTFYAVKEQGKKEEEKDTQIDITGIWNVHAVLNVLYSLVAKSNINEQLKEFNNGRNPDSVAGEFGCHIFYKMLGYFSLIGLLRLHTILGDYYLAIKVLENIDLNRQQLQSMAISRVLACQVTTFYYVGFAYMMMRRYSEAIRTFSNILVYLQRTKPAFFHRTFQIDLIDKQTDQTYKLLGICLTLHPQRIDESILAHLNEKMRDSLIKLQSGDVKEFEHVFRLACPKIISFAAGNKAYKHQVTIFLEEVEHQQKLLEIRSFLKFYTTMPLGKLAEFLEIPVEEFHQYLLCFKHKMQNISGSKTLDVSSKVLDNEFQLGSDVDFYIDKNMIHIADTKVAPRYGDYFLRQIYRFDDLYHHISKIVI